MLEIMRLEEWETRNGKVWVETQVGAQTLLSATFTSIAIRRASRQLSLL